MNHDSRAYHPANFSRHPREVLSEIQNAGELDDAERIPSVYGRIVPRNPKTGGNAFFEGIARRQGFDGLPLVTSDDEIERMVKERLERSSFSGDPATEDEFMEQGVAGVFALYRYLYEPDGVAPSPGLENARNFAHQFRSGPLFAGLKNRYGAGIYFIPYLGVLNGPAVVVKAAFRLEAKITGFGFLCDQMREDGLDPTVPQGFDPGIYAACRGYDAFFVQDDQLQNFYAVVLNRTALAVCDTDIIEGATVL